MFDAKVLIKRLPSFKCSKNYGNTTRETNFKVAVNVANPNSLMKKTLVPLMHAKEAVLSGMLQVKSTKCKNDSWQC